MLILNTGWRLGDVLCSFPAIAEAGKRTDRIDLLSRSSNAVALMPSSDRIRHIDSIEDFRSIEGKLPQGSVKCVNPWDAMAYGHGKGIHMIQSYFHLLDLEVPAAVPTPILNLDNSSRPRQFDVLVSPYSGSDNANNKLWPFENWQLLIDELVGNGLSVAVLGTSADPREFSDVSYIFDETIPTVAAVLRASRHGLISIDNGLSHLAHIVGVNHLLLYPVAMHPAWVNNPNSNCVRIIEAPSALRVETVKSKLDEFLAMPG
jgi:ADP-heptose:LPS heptosyltransferase